MGASHLNSTGKGVVFLFLLIRGKWSLVAFTDLLASLHLIPF